MADFFGKCGCNCGKCAAFIGNLKTEDDKQKCSDGWKKYLNISLKADYCVCNGCQAASPWKDGFMLPDRSCLIRKCTENSGLKTCANCGSFPCSFVEERSKVDYSRGWVEKRVGEAISDEDYETFVQPYETYKHLVEIRSSLKEGDIIPSKSAAPLKAKISPFPEVLLSSSKEANIFKLTHTLMSDIIQCKNESTYIDKILTERRIKPALVILWSFAAYGELIKGNDTRLLISGDMVQDRPEFNNIVRKRDNNWQGSAGQVVVLLKSYGLKMEHTALGNKKWTISLSCTDDSKSEFIYGLKLFTDRLIEKHGHPEFKGSWKYKGNAFKYFETVDFTAI